MEDFIKITPVHRINVFEEDIEHELGTISNPVTIPNIGDVITFTNFQLPEDESVVETRYEVIKRVDGIMDIGVLVQTFDLFVKKVKEN